MIRSRGWPTDLDVASLIANGFQPYAFRDFVFKIHQRCNLACDYCYVYTMGDSSWRDRPMAMAPEVVRAAAQRIAEHAETHRLDEVRVILHGGEPLMVGREGLRATVSELRSAIAGGARLRVAIQTNGVLLDERMLDLLGEEGVEVGVSLDGAPADNDRHRRYADGRGSAAAVERALALLSSERYRPNFAGILSAVDPETDPVGTYEALIRYRPPVIDFLLPHANWNRPPARPGPSLTPYGDWLISVFDRWYDAPVRETGIRILDEILNLVLGGASRSEHVGLSPVTVVVVESDGSIEQVDTLRASYPGAGETGLHVATDSFDDALRHPGVVARQLGVRALAAECLSCPIHRLCGAGHYPHRYSFGSGFLNRSVYCDDLSRIIAHVQSRVAIDLERLSVVG
ncbi:FxsB family radical SAM/SPASM domain protein [Actinoplanes sp. LDG1-06]|uniref:FxsB family radical SAM/SPASM domain protein n=1 Tax=Paractinoplanes ovalisporus TaxID=2810368 RepID=A0ABS2A911_9ACTN|nr:FxsB family cyclophane-forming radical SAM/SPASM peptide maturase [Actinoplanes ovalisporus]MBM2615741.1 FxsB family radical SAM/SPASM domain protein [Actinoplanes ovalisporus]